MIRLFKSFYLSAIFGLLVSGYLVGCANLSMLGGGREPSPPVLYGPGQAPLFYVRYLPYPRQNGRLTAPIPDYDGWTEERMERDLRRMVTLGLSGCVVEFPAVVFADSFRSNRIRRFVQLAGAQGHDPAFTVVLHLVSSGDGVALSPKELADWIMTGGTHRSPAMWRPSGRAAFVVGGGIEVSGAPHPACEIVRSGGPGADWAAFTPDVSARWTPYGPYGMSTVFAGWRGDSDPVDAKGKPLWVLPRGRGRALRAELWHAFAAKPKLILISSWNDFQAGDFIEPNALDGELTSKVLREEIARVRQSCSVLPSPAGDTKRP